MGRRPTQAAAAEQLIGTRLRARAEKSGEQRTLTIEFRGHPEILPVISLPVDSVVLNPDTHRIRAQKSLDPEGERALEQDPYGDPAQKYLQHLLSRDPINPDTEDNSFKELKASLAEYGQEEPGIVTRSGVLINANTRCVALRELIKPEILVAVLPSDSGDSDTEAIELALQLRKEHKRDYSFVNELLAIDARVARGDKPSDIQKDFRMRSSTFARAIWILQQIRDVIERSRVTLEDGTEAKMRYVDFEIHQGKLEELYRSYSKLVKEGKQDQAARLLNQRLAAVALDKSKTDVRLIDEDFLKVHAPEVLPEGEFEAEEQSIPGLPGIKVAGESGESKRVSQLADDVFKARAIAQVPERATSEEVKRAEARMNVVNESVERALNKAGRNARLKKTQDAPNQFIEDAAEDISAARQAIATSKSSGTFDPEDIENALVSLRKALVSLAQHIRPAMAKAESGDGVEWLMKSVS